MENKISRGEVAPLEQALWNRGYMYVIVIPWVVRLYVEIIHELQRVDCLTYSRTNMFLLFYTTYINVHLAHRETFRAKVGKGGTKVVELHAISL